jgi:hypothetical protein
MHRSKDGRVTLAEYLDAATEGSKPHRGMSGTESDWLPLSDFELRGGRLQLLESRVAGNAEEGIILPAPAGRYLIEGKAVTYGTDRRLSRLRVRPADDDTSRYALGEQAGTIGVDFGGLAVADVDLLATWAAADDDAYQDWSYAFSFDRDETAGVFDCPAAGTRVAFAEAGFGDGSYPVFYLLRGGQRVGLEAECVPPGTPYPFDSR